MTANTSGQTQQRPLLASIASRQATVVLVGGVLLALLGYQLFTALLPLPQLLEHVVNDDTFYYLEVASRVAAGRGFTFDGLHSTNGFQPAWQLLLAAIALISRDKDALLRHALILCALLNLCAGGLFYAISRRFWRGAYALLPLLLWASVQFTPRLALSGMETSLNWLLFCAVLYLCLVVTEEGHRVAAAFQRHRARALVASGFLCGLLILARIDNAIYAACAAMVLSGIWPAKPFKDSKAPTRWREWPRDVLLIGLGMAILLVPYAYWNLSQFGTLLPVSGVVKQKYHFLLISTPNGGYASLKNVGYSLTQALVRLSWVFSVGLKVLGFGTELWQPSVGRAALISLGISIAAGFGCLPGRWSSTRGQVTTRCLLVLELVKTSILIVMPFWAVYGATSVIIGPPVLAKLVKGGLIGVAVLSAILLGARRKSSRMVIDLRVGIDRKSAVLLVFAGGMVVHALVLAFTLDYFLDYTHWYFANWFTLVAILLALVLQRLGAAFSGSGTRIYDYVLLAWFVMGFAITGYRASGEVLASPLTPPYGANGRYQAARWLAAYTLPGAVVATYNAGIIGYFSERDTINLDGLINSRELIPYLFGPQTMNDYLAHECPDYFTDSVPGTVAEGTLPPGDVFLRIDKDFLEPKAWIATQGWLGRAQTQIIFEVRKNCCRQAGRGLVEESG